MTMKATCPREGLLSACQLAGSAVAARDVKPILSNIKAIANKNGCMLLATDLELGIRLEVRSVKVDEAGDAILPAARLIAILREATDEELVIEANSDAATVRGQFNEFEMPSENPGDFPDVPNFGDDKYHELPAGPLRDMIKRTVFAAARDSTRWAVNGVLWEITGGQVKLIATDSRRLAMASGTGTSHGAGDTKGHAHIVPTKAMTLLERLLQDAGESVKIALRPNEALFQTERATLVTRLVEGRFPPYQELLGKKLPVKIPLDANRFHSAVRQANIMAGDESKRVGFKFAKNKLLLEAHGHDTGRAKVEMPLEYEGKELTINFDAGFLIEMLRILPSDAALTLEMLDANTPAVFKSGPDYVYLVMPLT
jgi:DNA polymerase-3 subunit beta